MRNCFQTRMEHQTWIPGRSGRRSPLLPSICVFLQRQKVLEAKAVPSGHLHHASVLGIPEQFHLWSGNNTLIGPQCKTARISNYTFPWIGVPGIALMTPGAHLSLAPLPVWGVTSEKWGAEMLTPGLKMETPGVNCKNQWIVASLGGLIQDGRTSLLKAFYLPRLQPPFYLLALGVHSVWLPASYKHPISCDN